MEPQVHPDVVSLRLWKSGNTQGFNELIARYQKPLFHFILRIVRDQDEARDVLQETFVRFYRSLPKLQEDRNLKSWLYQTANNLSIDWLRKRKPDRVFAVDHQDPSFLAIVDHSEAERPDTPVQQYQKKQIQETVLQAIEQLPQKQRTMMTLRSCKGLSIKEIAEIMECSEKTVGTTLFNARKKLMKLLKPLFLDLYGETAIEELA